MIMDRISSVAIIIIFPSDPPLIEGQVFLRIEHAFSYFSVIYIYINSVDLGESSR